MQLCPRRCSVVKKTDAPSFMSVAQVRMALVPAEPKPDEYALQQNHIFQILQAALLLWPKVSALG